MAASTSKPPFVAPFPRQHSCLRHASGPHPPWRQHFAVAPPFPRQHDCLLEQSPAFSSSGPRPPSRQQLPAAAPQQACCQEGKGQHDSLMQMNFYTPVCWNIRSNMASYLCECSVALHNGSVASATAEVTCATIGRHKL